MKPPKKSKRLFTKKKIVVFLFIALIAFATSHLRINITSLAQNLLPTLLPQTHQSFYFDKAELNGDLSISMKNLSYEPDPPLKLNLENINIRLSIIQFLFGQLNITKLSANRVDIELPKETPWLNSRIWNKKKSEILERKEWLSFLNSKIEIDTLAILLDKNTFTFSDFEINSHLNSEHLDLDADWDFMSSNFTPNLYEGRAKFAINLLNSKVEIKSNSPLGSIFIEANSAKSIEELSGKMVLDSRFENISAWLFKPQTQLKGRLNAQLDFSTNLLSPLDRLTAKGELNAESIQIEGLALQTQNIIQSMAPEFKTIKMNTLSFETLIDSKNIILQNITADGPQFNLKGKLTSDWDANFFSRLNLILSKSSTEKLSSLAQDSFDKNENGEAYFPVEISGTPKDHSLTNLGQLVGGAVGNHIKKVGSKIFGIF